MEKCRREGTSGGHLAYLPLKGPTPKSDQDAVRLNVRLPFSAAAPLPLSVGSGARKTMSELLYEVSEVLKVNPYSI